MPILDLQRQLRRLGKIRMGAQVATANGKSRPAKLDHWRLTSASAELLEAAAGVYGGNVQQWAGSPHEGGQFELYTETDTLRVAVPPGEYAFSQWYEQWSAGGCQRRCDGITEQLTGQACLCPADLDERAKRASNGGACKMTTRLSVLLPDVPDIGTWMLESHGYYAAVELAGADDLIRAAGGGRIIPAQLRIEQRTAKRGGETRRYAVPVLELTTVTSGMLMTGEAPAIAGGNGRVSAGGRTELSPPARAALAPAAPRPQPPLPHEIDAGAPLGEATVSQAGGDRDSSQAVPPAAPPPDDDAKRRAQQVARWVREAGITGDDRKAFLQAFSGGRYHSAYEVPDDARDLLRDVCKRVAAGELRLDADADDPVLVKTFDGLIWTGGPAPAEVEEVGA